MAVKVYSKTAGAEVEVSPEDAQRGVSSGDYEIRQGKVRVVGPEYKTGTVDAANLSQALAQGWRVADEDQVAQTKLRREESTGGAQALAAVEAAASGATFGVSRLVQKGLGADPDRMRMRREALGDAATIAEVGGGLIGGGGSVAAKGAGMLGRAAKAVPAARIAQQGARVEKAVATALGGSKAAKAAGFTARGAYEGGVAGAGVAIDEAVLYDQEITPEALVGGGLAGVMFGGGVSGSLYGIGSGAARLSKGALARVTSGAAKRAGSGAGESLMGKAYGWATKLAGGEAEAGQRVGDILAKDPKRLHSVISNRKALEAEAAEIFGPGLSRVRSAVEDARVSTEGAATSKAFKGRLPVDADDMSQLAKDDLLQGLKRDAMDMTRKNNERAFTAFDQNVIDDVSDFMERTVVDAEAKGARGTFDSLKRLRHDIQKKVQDTGGWGELPRNIESKVAHTNRWLRDAYSRVNGQLGDVGVFGDLAKRHAAQNEAYAAFKEAEGFFKGEAKGSGMAKLFSETGEVSTREAVKISRMYGKMNGGALANTFDDALEAQMGYLRKAKELNELPADAVRKIDDAEKAVKQIRERLSKQAEDAGLYDDWLSMRAAEGNNSVSIGAMSTLGPTVGGALGLGMGGPIGLVAGSIIGGLTRPATSSRTMAAIMSQADRFGLRLEKVGKNLTRRARSAAPRRARGVRSPGATAARGYRALTRDEREKKATAARKSAIAYAQNPTALTDRILEGLGEANAEAPNTVAAAQAVAQRAAMFLASKKPPVLDMPMTGQDPLIDPVSAAKWSRYVEAVSDPLSTLERTDDGTLTAEHVEAIKAVYPETFARLQNQIGEELAKAQAAGEAVPIDVRQMLGLIYEIPSTPGRTPEALAAIQAAIQSAPEQEVAEAQAPKSKTIRKHNMDTTQGMLPTERVESGAVRT